MDYLEGITNPGWLVFAIGFLGIIFFLAVVRQRESKRIMEKFNEDDIIITSFGVNYFGLESEKGGPLRSSGALVLLKHGLYYRARYRKIELYIKKGTITYIGISDVHKKKPLYQNAVVIKFIGDNGKEEKAAFRMPYPNQWMMAISKNLITNQSSAISNNN